MASAPTNNGMREEATCPVCQQLMTDPVSFYCRHSCCYSCGSGSVEVSSWSFHCPSCRAYLKMERDWVRNVALSEAEELLEYKMPCEEHKELRQLFCEATWDLICESCARSPQHSGHQHLAKNVKDTLPRSSVPESVSSEPDTDYSDSELDFVVRKRIKNCEGGTMTAALAVKTSGEQPGTSEEQPGTSREQPRTSGEQPGTSVEKPETSGEQPGMSGEQPETSGEQPAMSGEQPNSV